MPECLSSLGAGKQGIKVEGLPQCSACLRVFWLLLVRCCAFQGSPTRLWVQMGCLWTAMQPLGCVVVACPVGVFVTLQGLNEAVAALLLAAGAVNVQAELVLLRFFARLGLVACCTVRFFWVFRSFQVHVCRVTVCVSSNEDWLCGCNCCCQIIP